MADAISVSAPISGTDKTLTFETGKFALQSQGAVIAKIGKTQVLATANAAKGQIVITVIGADQVNPHDVLAINAASASFMISGIPFDGPIGAVRLAYSQDGSWIPHPTFEEGEEATFEIVVAGRELDNGDVAIMMVEAGGTEKSFTYYEAGAPKVDELVIASGLDASKQYIKESIKLQRQLVASVIATRGPIEPLKYTPVAELAGTPDAPGKFAGQEKQIKEAVRSLTKKLVRKRVVNEGIRIDGRGPADLRPVSAEVGLISTAHGTGLFQRGETQVLNVLTMAMPKMNQMIDSITPETSKRYMHDYNMAPWANGETGRGQHLDGVGMCIEPFAHGRWCANSCSSSRYCNGTYLRRR